MLIYIKCFGVGLNETISMEVDPQASVLSLSQSLEKYHPHLLIKRLMFAGQQLPTIPTTKQTDTTTIANYDITKECTLQLFGETRQVASNMQTETEIEQKTNSSESISFSLSSSAASTSSHHTSTLEMSSSSSFSSSLPPHLSVPSFRPLLLRDCTAEEVQYGDVLCIQLIAARNLVSMDWGNRSDPYVILAYGQQMARSRIIKRSLQPLWNETFVFYVQLSEIHTQTTAVTGKRHKRGDSLTAATAGVPVISPSLTSPSSSPSSSSSSSSSSSTLHHQQHHHYLHPSSSELHILCYDHDYITPDDPLGFIILPLDCIPREVTIEKYFPLNGVKKGEILLSLRRESITSPEMRKKVMRLSKRGKGIKEREWKREGITKEMLMGEEPFVVRQEGETELTIEATRERGNSNNWISLSSPLSSPTSLFSSLSPSSSSPSSSSSFFSSSSTPSSSIPALLRLQTLLLDPHFQFYNQRTRHKVMYMLRSSHVLYTADPPSRFLFVGNIPKQEVNHSSPSPSSSSSSSPSLSSSLPPALASLYLLLRRHFPHRIKRIVVSPSFHSFYISFKRIESCIAAFIFLLDYQPLVTSFCSRYSLMEAMLNSPMCCLVNLSGPHSNNYSNSSSSSSNSNSNNSSISSNSSSSGSSSEKNTWKWGWLYIEPPPSGSSISHLVGLRQLSGEFHHHVVFRLELSKSNCLLVRSGPWSIELCDRSHQSTYYIKARNSERMEELYQQLKQYRNETQHQNNTLSPLSAGVAPPAENTRSESIGSSNGLNGESFIEQKENRIRSTSSSSSSSSSFSSSPLQIYCNKCHQHKSLSDVYTLDSEEDPLFALSPSSPTPLFTFNLTACIDCHRSLLLSALTNRTPSILSSYSTTDASELLSSSAYNEFVELSTQIALDAQPELYIRCSKCNVTMERTPRISTTSEDPVDAAYFNSIVTSFTIEPSPLSRLHFSNYRLLCRACHTDFCCECKSFPYHTGFTCEEFVECKNAPKCRYCNVAVTSKNRGRMKERKEDIEGFAVCDRENCAEKMKEACLKRLECGHACFGMQGEEECCPCLVPDCKGRMNTTASIALSPSSSFSSPSSSTSFSSSSSSSSSSSFHSTADSSSSCPICFTDDLGASPCIFLSCRHIFHAHCQMERVKAGFTTPYISFDFLHCALCKQRIKHTKLKALIEPYEELERKVERLALMRLKYEGLESCKQLTDLSSEWYGQPVAFAMQYFMFYQCYSCINPYFAGARACGAADTNEFNRSELLCVRCSPGQSFHSCPTHGSTFLIYKCRFCCSYSTFFCFGKTHFCKSCHDGTNPRDVWTKLVTSAGKNVKRIEEYIQCNGIREKVMKIARDEKYKTEEERMEAYEKTWSDPRNCPLRVKHPPSGIEFGLGCGLCSQNSGNGGEREEEEFEEKMKEYERKMKMEEEEKGKQPRQWNVNNPLAFRSARVATIMFPNAGSLLTIVPLPVPTSAAAEGKEKKEVTRWYNIETKKAVEGQGYWQLKLVHMTTNEGDNSCPFSLNLIPQTVAFPLVAEIETIEAVQEQKKMIENGGGIVHESKEWIQGDVIGIEAQMKVINTKTTAASSAVPLSSSSSHQQFTLSVSITRNGFLYQTLSSSSPSSSSFFSLSFTLVSSPFSLLLCESSSLDRVIFHFNRFPFEELPKGAILKGGGKKEVIEAKWVKREESMWELPVGLIKKEEEKKGKRENNNTVLHLKGKHYLALSLPPSFPSPLSSYTLLLDLQLESLLSCPSALFNTDPTNSLCSSPLFLTRNGYISGTEEANWDATSSTIQAGRWQRVVVAVDAPNCVCNVYIDGAECKVQNVAAQKFVDAVARGSSTLQLRSELLLFASLFRHHRSARKRVASVTLFNRYLSPSLIHQYGDTIPSITSSSSSASSSFSSSHSGGLVWYPLPLPLTDPSISGFPLCKSHSTMSSISHLLYFAGGEGNRVRSTAFYSLHSLTNQLTKLPSLLNPRCMCSLVAYKNCLYLYGGKSIEITELDARRVSVEMNRAVAVGKMERYDVEKNQWESIEENNRGDSDKKEEEDEEIKSWPVCSPPAVAGHSAVVLNDCMYVVGGILVETVDVTTQPFTVYCYSFKSDKWTQVKCSTSNSSSSSKSSSDKSVTNDSGPRGIWMCGVAASSDTIYVYGGSVGPNAGMTNVCATLHMLRFKGKARNSAEWILLSSPSPSPTSPSLVASSAASAASSAASAVSSSSSLSAHQPAPSRRVYGGMVYSSTSSSLYLWGGLTDASNLYPNALHSYNLLTNEWKIVSVRKEGLPSWRYGHVIGYNEWSESLYVLGGVAVKNAVQVYADGFRLPLYSPGL